MKENNSFEYTYSVPTPNERREVEEIKKRYEAPAPDSDGLARLRKLDQKVRNIPLIVALTMGVLGTLVFGTGLTMILEWGLLLYGTLVSVVGLAPISLAHFAHKRIETKLKTKYADEIIKLSDEILSEKNSKQ